ncbi:MAG: amidohydrolase [Anaerolineaceae bacterium]|nr:amidohydrolase [Anaerolineaceae bacterium]
MTKHDVYKYIEDNKARLSHLSDQVWDFAETAFQEEKSMESLCKELEFYGFSVEKAVADIPTAFIGTWGSGSPVIGFLGEFDALSGLSQKACIAEEEPIVEGGNGHGCGHNLLGVGSLGAAIGVKEYLEKSGKSGTVKYFGCPAEEGGSGKAFMARAGVFNGIDAALTWHPASFNAVADVGFLANYQILYKFKGKSSHAAASPQNGRSALDAMELMNVGVQFLREHIIQDARIHYAITNTGGFSPNVVQSRAEVLYLIRAPQMEQVEEIYQRVNKIAKGMAMATETEVEIEFIKSCANLIPNRALNALLHKNMLDVPSIDYTEEELALGKAIDDSLGGEINMMGLGEAEAAMFRNMTKGKALFTEIIPFNPEREIKVAPGSSDVGDVSWNVPTAQIGATCWTLRTPAHSWQVVSIGRSEIAHKGMIYASQVLAGAAIDLIEDGALLETVTAEFANRMQGRQYVSPIPADVKPRAISEL